MTDKIKLTADQVLSIKSGWVKFISASGSQMSARRGAVEIEGQDAAPAKSHPVFGEAPVAAPTTTGEKTMAKAKTAKKETAGVRTIGGKAVDIKSYKKTKTASGSTSYNNGDEVAEKLEGKDLDAVYAQAAKTLKVDEKELRTKYKHLNAGMQRMALGNRMRKIVNAKAA